MQPIEPVGIANLRYVPTWPVDKILENQVVQAKFLISQTKNVDDYGTDEPTSKLFY